MKIKVILTRNNINFYNLFFGNFLSLHPVKAYLALKWV